MSKSERLYKNSPSVERDKESGEVGIKRPSEADKESAGLSGSPLPGSDGEMPIAVEQMHDRHKREMKDTHKRHEDEIKDMHKRHLKEVAKEMGKEDAEEKDEKTGEGQIKKVEEDKKS